MTTFWSAVAGVVLGAADSFLALRPFSSGCPWPSPRQTGWRCVARLTAQAAVLAALMAAGANSLALMLALVVGYWLSATRVLRRSFR